MMKKGILIIGWLIGVVDCLYAQTAPGIEWQNTIGGSEGDILQSIQQTTDGGYILGGYSHSNISGDKTENINGNFDYWIVKTDSLGSIQWQNTIGGNHTDRLYSIQQTADGGYILGGYSGSYISGDKTENCIGNWDYWIVKTDSLGNIQWQNTIGGTDDDRLFTIQQTADGGYISGGYSSSNISGDKTENSMGEDDYWIVKTDSLGQIQWQNTIGGIDVDRLTSLQQTLDGGYILGGYSWSSISGDKTENFLGGCDYWIVKTDANGNIQWQNTIGGNDWDELYSIQQTSDGGYIFGGDSQSNISNDKTENSNGSADYWVVKTDMLGNIQWQNTIGGNNGDILYSIERTVDDGYILGGYSLSDISGDKTENRIGWWDYWIVKLDVNGNIQWQSTIGGDTTEYLYSIQQTIDGGYMLGGYSQSNISGDKTENCIGQYDYWIVKLFPDTVTGIIQLQNQTSNIQISPNPSTDYITIQYNVTSAKETTVEVFNIYGQVVKPLTSKGGLQNTGKQEITIDIKNLPAGIYFVKMKVDGKEEVKKVVKL
ncbi:MAG: T9SS type A sorting domain-containing protein [Bacteroidia bacterium]